MGGYVCGSREVVDYLRFFARSSLFTASLPAAICAGPLAALRVMREEPQHRERLWRNARRLWEGLREAGLCVEPLESPILPVFLGHEALLWAFSRDLFLAGFKCGHVCYPALPVGESIVRLSVTSRHTDEDVERAVEAFARLAARHGIRGRTREEIRQIGSALPLPEPLSGADGRRAPEDRGG